MVRTVLVATATVRIILWPKNKNKRRGLNLTTSRNDVEAGVGSGDTSGMPDW